MTSFSIVSLIVTTKHTGWRLQGGLVFDRKGRKIGDGGKKVIFNKQSVIVNRNVAVTSYRVPVTGQIFLENPITYRVVEIQVLVTGPGLAGSNR